MTPPSLPNAVHAVSSISALGGLAERLSNQVYRVQSYVDRARSVAHDVFGPAPESGSKNGNAPVAAQAPGHYHNLSGWIDSLDYALGELGSHLDRLSGI